MTDTGTLAVFDPASTIPSIEPDFVGWFVPFLKVPAVARGDVAVLSLGGDGVYRVRVTDDALTPDESAYASSRFVGCGVRIHSGTLAVGGVEILPEPGQQPPPETPAAPTMPIAAGLYQVDAYWIDWFESRRWWRDEADAEVEDRDDGDTRGDRPADVVLIVRPRPAGWRPLDSEPRLIEGNGSWLFPGERREIGPAPGMLLTTTVRKGPAGLTLKACGPGNYDAALTDYSHVAWKDRVRLRVIDVDHTRRTLVGELVEKIGSSAK